MSIKNVLQEMVESVDGALGAIVMGYDGIALDEYVKESSPLDLQVLSVEYATVLKEIRKAVDVLGSGTMEEISINTDVTRVIIRVIDNDLFVILALLMDGNYGKGRYVLRQKSLRINEILQ
ncbi:MAG: roadblock/LC7 domain-containing protein [Geobacteraceae bacterium]|nr:roadblock/LC7 domain-containing protein [Geobacteraceae bacterium]